MIPSLNSQKTIAYPQAPIDGCVDWTAVDKTKLPYVCDCCRKIISPEANNMGGDYWHWSMNPRLVEVGGVTYYGCSTECARILFDIHHRYAQLKG